MTRLLSLESNSENPFRLLGPGSDPDNPSISDIIFDANNATYLVLQKGSVSTPGSFFDYSAGATNPIVLSRQVSGRRPLFLVGEYVSASQLLLPFRGSSFVSAIPGGGGAVGNFGDRPNGVGLMTTETHLYPLNFYRANIVSIDGIGQIFPNYHTIQYAILSNTI